MEPKMVDEMIGSINVQGMRWEGAYVVAAPTGYFVVVGTLNEARKLARVWARRYA